MYELVNRSTCIVIRNCLLIISAVVLGEMRALNKSWEKLMSGNCCVLIIYIYIYMVVYKQMDLVELINYLLYCSQ